MQAIARRRRLWQAAGLTILALFALIWAVFIRDSRSPDVREFSAIRDDWELAALGVVMEGRLFPGMSPPKPVPPLRGDAKLAADRRLLKRCLAVAEKYPGTVGELGALFLASVRGAGVDTDQKAQSQFVARVSTTDLSHLYRVFQISRLGGRDVQPAVHVISPAIVSRVRERPDDPNAAALLAYLCSASSFDSQAEEPPAHYAEVADLIAAEYAESSDISAFCESLGAFYFSPHWASGFESHLRRVLEANEHRNVRCTAAIALASVVQLSVDRQDEAEELFETFLDDFDGQHEYPYQAAEQVLRHRAEQRLAGMKFAPIGQPTPEMVGVDLDGNPMSLSEYRGKVVLVSFWATWCGPCMKLIEHERELAVQHAGQPLAIVGINGDENADNSSAAVKEYGITWRSFHDKRPEKESISTEWTAFYPTVILIDHHGTMRKRWTGSPPIEVLDQMIDDLIETAQADGTPGVKSAGEANSVEAP